MEADWKKCTKNWKQKQQKDPAVSCKLHGISQGLAEQHKPTDIQNNLCWRTPYPSSAEGTTRPEHFALGISIHSMKISKDEHCTASQRQHVPPTAWLSLEWTSRYSVRTSLVSTYVCYLLSSYHAEPGLILQVTSLQVLEYCHQNGGLHFSFLFIALLSHCPCLVVIQTIYCLGALFWILGCLSDEVIAY